MKKNNENNLGNTLKAIIRSEFNSQADFAEHAGLSQREVSQLVLGRMNVLTVKLATKLAACTKLSAKEWLFIWVNDYE